MHKIKEALKDVEEVKDSFEDAMNGRSYHHHGYAQPIDEDDTVKLV